LPSDEGTFPSFFHLLDAQSMPKDEDYEKGCVKGNMVYKIQWTDPPKLMPVESMCGHIPQVSILDTKEVHCYHTVLVKLVGKNSVLFCGHTCADWEKEQHHGKKKKSGGKNSVEWFQHSILCLDRSQVFSNSKHDSDMGFRHGKKRVSESKQVINRPSRFYVVLQCHCSCREQQIRCVTKQCDVQPSSSRKQLSFCVPPLVFPQNVV